MAEFNDYFTDSAAPTELPAAPSELARRTPAAAPNLGLPSGSGLGKYRILERIRTYHNAVVYKARDLMLDRLVALKQMSPELMDNPTACGNFKKEAQLLARVPKDARHVLNVHELIENEIGLFIVEEYINGDWLESLIDKRQIGVKEAPRLLKSAAIGLRDLHANKIVHRDINPGNIIVTRGANAKIANFYSAAQEGDIIQAPVVTPKYSPPELLLERTYDDRVDIYSLGVAIYEVCVGRTLWDKYFAEIVNSRMPVSGWIAWHSDLKRKLPDPARLNPQVPPPLSSILRQMTAKRLEERYTCIEEVLAALARHYRRPVRDPLSDKPSLPWAFIPAPTAPPTPRPRPAGPPVREDLLTSTQRLYARTSTHTVRQAPSRSPEHAPYAAPGARRTMPDYGFARRQDRRARGTAARRGPRPAAQPIPLVMPAPIVPRAAKKPVRKKRHPILKRAVAAALLISLGASGYVAYDRFFQYVPPHRIEGLLTRGIDAFGHDDLKSARDLLTEAANLDVKHPEHQRKRFVAQTWLLMIEAKEALHGDQFDKAQRLLNEVEKFGGVSPSKVYDLQQLVWSRKDAYKLKADSYDEMKAGHFGAVEQRLDAYEKVATSAGLDPNALKDQLEVSRRRNEYEKWLKDGEEALAKQQFEQAFTACAAAEGFLVTSDTRDLRKRIQDAQHQADNVARGDRAMLTEDFEEAVRAYEAASGIKASTEVEQKMRLARAHVLLREAKDSIGRGELLLGEDKLNSSIWNHPLFEAQVKLEKMRSAFDAARQARAGDHAVATEDYKEAIQIYQKVLPSLPSPADLLIKKKIDEARRLDAIARGQKALKREDWEGAIDALEEAQKLGFDATAQEMLIRAKAKMP